MSMRKHVRRVLVVGGALLLPALAYTQAVTDETRNDALIREVRLLRRAVERHVAVSARAQLLVGRLALQEQRVGRMSGVAERAAIEAFSAQQQAEKLRGEHAELRRSHDEAADPNVREALEQHIRTAGRRMMEQGSATRAIEARLAEARQALDAERARYDELDAAFQRLERDLEGTER
jgi:hypothetical protein